MDYYCDYQSPIGKIRLACDDQGIIGLWFEGARYYGQGLSDKLCQITSHPHIDQTKAWLDIYFSGEIPPFKPPLHFRGTPFRQMVWEVLSSQPYGQSISYGQLAQTVASSYNMDQVSPRAVGGAVGHNPLSLLVPCHRVLGAKGDLIGYAGGLSRKVFLLDLEGIRNNG